MLALVLSLNIVLAAIAFGLMTGLPLWMVLRHPDRNPAETSSLPAYMTRREAARAGIRVGAPRQRTVRVMVPSAQY